MIRAENDITLVRVDDGLEGPQGPQGEQGMQGPQGEQGIQGEKGDTGADGKTSYFHIKYSAVANPTSSLEMSETPLAYIGTYVDFTEADSTDPTKYTWSRFEGIQGEKGEQGIPGIGTDGKTSYLHIAYATSADGSEGFSISESANKTYIGQYTDFVSTDSTDPTKYAWTKIKGEMSAEQVAQLNKASQDASAAVSKVDNLEVGGRNLLRLVDWGRYRSSKWHEDIINVTNDGYTFTATGNPTDLIGFKVPVESGVITISGKTGLVSQTIYFTVYDSNGDIVQAQNHASITTKNGQFVLMLTMPSGASELHIGFGYYPYSSAIGDYTVSNLKIEKGNKATDWTPAPEDVDAGIANATKVATNYLHYDSTDGLVLGNKESGSWVGYRTQIDTDSFNVLDENGNIIASYGSNEVELGKGNPSAIIKMCDGKAYVKNYVVGSQNTSVFCGQDVTVVGEWEGASEAYALFKQGFINIGQASSHIKFSNENGNMNQVEIQGQNIRMVSASTIGNFDCYMKPRFFTMAGEIKMWAGDAIPDGWLLCDGSEVSKTDYPKLYKAIGDLWGTPNSSSNFKLPNLTGRVPVGYNSADTDTTETFGKVGATGGARGAWYHTHTIGSSGAHSHASQGRMEGSGTGANIFESYNGASKTRSVNVPRSGTNGNHTHSPGSSGSAGNKLAADKANMPPYAVVKYIICAI